LAIIDRFGAQAVYGRALTANEILRMMRAEHVLQAYVARTASADWAEWTERNPDKAELLIEAMKANNGK
jgi:hypothetical protein